MPARVETSSDRVRLERCMSAVEDHFDIQGSMIVKPARSVNQDRRIGKSKQEKLNAGLRKRAYHFIYVAELTDLQVHSMPQ